MDVRALLLGAALVLSACGGEDGEDGNPAQAAQPAGPGTSVGGDSPRPPCWAFPTTSDRACEEQQCLLDCGSDDPQSCPTPDEAAVTCKLTKPTCKFKDSGAPVSPDTRVYWFDCCCPIKCAEVVDGECVYRQELLKCHDTQLEICE